MDDRFFDKKGEVENGFRDVEERFILREGREVVSIGRWRRESLS